MLWARKCEFVCKFFSRSQNNMQIYLYILNIARLLLWHINITLPPPPPPPPSPYDGIGVSWICFILFSYLLFCSEFTIKMWNNDKVVSRVNTWIMLNFQVNPFWLNQNTYAPFAPLIIIFINKEKEIITTANNFALVSKGVWNVLAMRIGYNATICKHRVEIHKARFTKHFEIKGALV